MKEILNTPWIFALRHHTTANNNSQLCRGLSHTTVANLLLSNYMICVIIHSCTFICIYMHNLHKAHQMESCGYTVLSVHILGHMFHFQSYRIVFQRLWHCNIWRNWYCFMPIGSMLGFDDFQHLRFLSPRMIIFRQALPYLQQKTTVWIKGLKKLQFSFSRVSCILLNYLPFFFSEQAGAWKVIPHSKKTMKRPKQ